MVERIRIGIIGDEETIIGFSITGLENNVEDPNFIQVTKYTNEDELKEAFNRLVSREDLAIVLVCDFVADKIRQEINTYKQELPSLLEIPSKSKG